MTDTTTPKIAPIDNPGSSSVPVVGSTMIGVEIDDNATSESTYFLNCFNKISLYDTSIKGSSEKLSGSPGSGEVLYVKFCVNNMVFDPTIDVS